VPARETRLAHAQRKHRHEQRCAAACDD
jgi:hypothetical protein